MTIEDIKALKVAADEVLVLQFPEDTTFGEEELSVWESLTAILKDVGLEGRCLVLVADDVQMAVVKK